MALPPGFYPKGEKGKVCRFKKAIYGLKQLPRAWFDKFSTAISQVGFVRSTFDHSVFIKRDGGIGAMGLVQWASWYVNRAGIGLTRDG